VRTPRPDAASLMRAGPGGILRCLLVFLVMATCWSTANAEWFNPSWSYRKPVTVNALQVPAPQTNFPMLVSFTSGDLTKARADGFDILFTLDDGTTQLAHELESWNGATGELRAWVKVPTIQNGTQLYVYYGNLGASDQSDPPNVWDSDFSGVWHLHDDFLDSTINPNNGTNGGSSDAVGQIADGQDFDGTNDYVDVGSDASIDGVFAGGGTISAWIFPQGWGENGFGRIGDKSNDTSASQGWSFQLDNGNVSESIRFESGFSGGPGGWYCPDFSINLNAWQHVTAVYNSNSVANDAILYINGSTCSSIDHQVPTGSYQSDAPYGLRVGNPSGATSRTFDGIIDEVRVSDVVRSSNWIETEFNNQNAPMTFHAIGAEQAVADLSLAKIVDNGTPDVGSNVVFTLTVSNAGPSDASGVEVTDLLPSGYTYVSDDGGGSYVSGTGVWTAGNVAASGSATLNITATVNAAGVYLNTSEVTAAIEGDSDSTPNNGVTTEDDYAEVSTTPSAVADLSLTKIIDNGAPNVGSNVVFTLTVTNDGPSDATGVQVTDLLPSGYTYVSDDGAGAYDSGTGVWTVGTVAVGTPDVLNITAEVNGSGNYDNVAEVTASDSSDPDSTPGNSVPAEDDQDSVGVTRQPLSIVKRAFQLNGTPIPSGSTMPTGMPVKFLMYINNPGGPVANVSMQDLLDAVFLYVGGSIKYSNSVATCALITCTAAEEAAIFAAADGGTAGTDAVDGDVVSFTGVTLDIGSQNTANAQLDIAGDRVWGVVFTIRMQ